MEQFIFDNSGVIVSVLFGILIGLIIGCIGTVLYLRRK